MVFNERYNLNDLNVIAVNKAFVLSLKSSLVQYCLTMKSTNFLESHSKVFMSSMFFKSFLWMKIKSQQITMAQLYPEGFPHSYHKAH